MCWTPMSIKPKFTRDGRPNVNGETMAVPCNKCPPCLKRKMNAWAFRIQQEQMSPETISCEMITLTYATDHIPINPETGELVLDKKDVQLFFKRLRKNHDKKFVKDQEGKEAFKRPPIKYFACGEYGTHTLRPHYHVILFNHDQQLIQDSWQKGQVHYDQTNAATITYVLKYMMKDPISTASREPEFRLMSKGLGQKYITDKIKKWHHSSLEDRMYLNIENGKKIAMPRYYKERIYNDIQRKKISFHHQNLLEDQYYEKMNNQTDQDKYNEIQNHAAQFTKFKKQAVLNRNKI